MKSEFHLFSSIPRTLIPQEMCLPEAAAISSVLSVECIDEDIDSQEFIQAVSVAKTNFNQDNEIFVYGVGMSVVYF